MPPDVIHDQSSEDKVVAFLDTAIRTVFREQRLVMQRHLGTLKFAGELFWARTVTAGKGDGERNLLLALTLLAPVRDAAPDAVPDSIRNSIPAAPRDGDAQIGLWNNFAGALITEVGPGDRTALVAAIAVLQAGLGMSDARDDRVRCLGNLVHVLSLLHETHTDVEALEEAVRLARWLVRETPAGTPGHARGLGRLSDTLRLSYETGRDSAVLAEALDHARAVVAALPSEHPERVDRMTNLTGLLHLRSSDLGDTDSLREAIAISRVLVAEMSPGHPALARSLNNLGHNLEGLLSTDDDDDAALLDEIIEIGRTALGRIAPGDELRTVVLANLSRWHARRTAWATSRGDLEEALSLARQAVASVEGARVPGVALNALAHSLSKLHERTGNPAILDEAIAVARTALADSVNPKAQALQHMLLGNLLNNRYFGFGEQADAREAATVLRGVAGSTTVTLLDRIESATTAGKLAINLEEWPRAADDLGLAVGLLPDLTGWHLRAGDRERRLLDHGHLPTLAASCAIATGRPEQALEILEHGRGILFSEVATVHDGVGRLRESAPRLAAALDQVSALLRTTPEPDQRHELAIEQRRLIEEIRALPGFAQFLTPPRIEEILHACRSGPIVVPVLSAYRGDALIVTAEGVRHVPLPELTVDMVRRLSRNLLGGTEIALNQNNPPERRSLGEYSVWAGLGLLWDVLVRPVLDALNLLTRPADGVLPRIWWCPTGPLAFFPLHMAGRHEESNAFDLVVSSYTPTVRALGRTAPWRPGAGTRPLVVALPHTPGASDLPAADQEAALLAGWFPGCRLLRGSAATREKVLAALPHHEIAHLACHAGHDHDRGYAGHLILHDGRLQFSDIALGRTDRTGLAFLSACATARGQANLPDESLNLATSFQLAGFSQLVGSLWTVPDHATARVVEDFYGKLLTDQDVSVAHALHHAVHQLREREPDRPSLWAAHIHIGS